MQHVAVLTWSMQHAACSMWLYACSSSQLFVKKPLPSKQQKRRKWALEYRKVSIPVQCITSILICKKSTKYERMVNWRFSYHVAVHLLGPRCADACWLRGPSTDEHSQEGACMVVDAIIEGTVRGDELGTIHKNILRQSRHHQILSSGGRQWGAWC